MAFLDSQILISDNTLSSPSSVAVDVAGNVYVADSGNNRVLEIPVTASGFGPSVTLIDNLSHPGGVLVDWEGNLYISDSGNNRIVRLLAGPGGFGPPTTVASSLNAPGGLAIDSSDNLFVADTGNNRVVKFPAQGANFGAAIVIGSGFNAPSGVAIDPANNLFVADTGNNRIAKFTVASAYTTVTYLYTNITSPAGVAVDASYNLFIASSNSHRVYEAPWNVGANRYNTNVTLGNAWNMAVGVAADSKGNFYIVDAGAGRVWEIPTATQAFSPTAVGVVGSLQSYNFTLAAGTSIGGYAVLTQGSPSLDFADAGGSTCTPQTAVAASFCSVQVQFQPVGSGVRQGAVVLYDTNGNVVVTAYLFGTGIGAQTAFFPPQQLALGSNLSGPSGVAVDAAGNVYISDTGNNRIVEIPWANGAYGSQITLPVTQLNTPMGLAVDGAGNLYIASSGNDKIIELPRTASGFGPQIKIPVAVYVPSAVTFDGSGAFYIADTYDNLIVKLVWKGTAYSNVGPLGSYVKMPMGVAVDVTGNLFFSNPYLNNLIEVPLKSGKYQPQWTAATSRISYPTSVATDRNGDVYLLDTGNNRVLMYPATASGLGAQITVASGFNAPIGMTTDAGGNLYVADTGNNRIIRMSLGQPAPLSFLSTYVNTTSKDSAQSTLVQNTGNVATSIAAVSYPSDFPEDPSSTTSCVPGMALALGAGCPLAIDFSPQSVGALTESVSVSIAASAAQQTASVTASGVSLPRSNQTISFSQIANVTFGAAALKLSASASSGLAVTFQVVSGPATLASNGVTLTITGAGTITIAASQAGNSTYLAAQPVLVSFTVLPATLTITPNNATATYGAMPTSFGYSITGFVLGQNAGQVITGAPQITIDAGATAAVGAHALLAAIGTLQAANYQFVFNQGTLTVKQAALKITAVSTSMTYGAALPKFTWTASGFVNADTLAVVSGAPQFATSASSRSAAGSYSITPAVGTLSAANYSFTFVAGALTIARATLIVTADSQSMVYGSPVPNLTYTIQGLLGSDTLATVVTGAPTFTTTAGPKGKVGSYALSMATGSLKATNYAFTFVPGSITIVSAPLTVSPATVNLTYGQAIPSLTSLQLVGLVNGDTQATALTGSAALTTTATAGMPPGSAAINIQIGTLASANYTINLQPGTLVIHPATLTVTPTSATRVYGAANPALAYTLTGFVNGDTAATAVSGTPALTTPATASSPVGSYTVTASAGTLAATCYTFTFATGSFTVTRASLTITANPLSIVYGAVVPKLTYAITGFQNGETASVLTGAPTLNTSAAATPAAGSYSIAVSTTGLSAANYTFTTVGGVLNVAKAIATVTADSFSTNTGNAIPTLTYTVTGMVAGDQASSAITGAAQLSTTATATSAAGNYPITVANGTMAAQNYRLTLVNGTLTITQPAPTVSAPTPITPRLPNRRLP